MPLSILWPALPSGVIHINLGGDEQMTLWPESIDRWICTLEAAGRPETTRYLRRYQLERLAAELTARTPNDVDDDMLVDWFAQHAWGRETRRSYAAAVRSFWRWAVRAGVTDHDPTGMLPPMSAEEPNPRPAPRHVLDQARASADDRVQLMIRMAAELGMRRGEVARAHRDDLEQDLFGSWVLIVHGKGGKIRRVPVTDTLGARIRRSAGYLFPGRIDGHLAPATVGRLVSAVMPDAWAMHTLRHRFLTIAYAHDRDMFSVQQLAGHASPVTTRRYVKIPDAALRAHVEAVARAS